MSFESEIANGVLYVITDESSTDWLDLVTANDTVLLVENAVYRSPQTLPNQAKCYLLESDCNARAISPTIETINYSQWVQLVVQSAQTVRI